jgi:hypothetical protein
MVFVQQSAGQYDHATILTRGRLVHRLVHSFPKLQYVKPIDGGEWILTVLYRVQAQVQPITRSLL